MQRLARGADVPEEHGNPETRLSPSPSRAATRAVSAARRALLRAEERPSRELGPAIGASTSDTQSVTWIFK